MISKRVLMLLGVLLLCSCGVKQDAFKMNEELYAKVKRKHENSIAIKGLYIYRKEELLLDENYMEVTIHELFFNENNKVKFKKYAIIKELNSREVFSEVLLKKQEYYYSLDRKGRLVISKYMGRYLKVPWWGFMGASGRVKKEKMKFIINGSTLKSLNGKSPDFEKKFITKQS